MVNFREDWRGHLWQGRFASYPLDEKHLLAAARYLERKAGPEQSTWMFPATHGQYREKTSELKSLVRRGSIAR